ncbi:unnamed protein product [Rhizoctonia solani]|uniref:HAT C-terminal dimerisation domain-containing protein n=2 Tax=Rhizoctonia solani TaxID=456999 RepID=A0A8H3CBG1_9AGAM|nr:unnamed protein product [Rhizoctonia solani]
MLSVDYKTYTVKVHDLSAEPKTADNHLSRVLADIDFAEKEHGVRVIAWVSDAGGDSRAMRVRLNRMHPHLLVFDCWAHQINLIVGDILRLNDRLVEAAADAIEITKWMLHHSYLLGLFRQERARSNAKSRELTLPAITRWTSHYLSFDSLNSQSTALRSLLINHSDAFRKSAGRSPEKKEQVERIMARIEDRSFWMKLAELKLYLEPLAIAANVSQAPTTRLDHVLIELGRLYYTFSKFAFNPAIIKCVLESLERRWGKADQDAFILAVFLNPFIRARLFNPRNTLLNRWGLYGIVKRVFRRVFRQENDLELHEAFNDYYESRNEFHPDRWPYEEVQASCDRTGKPFNMLEVWTGILPYNAPNAGRHQLAYLATHILSIVANSAGCERLFSEMGNIHTKRRNRLAYNKVFDTAVVRMDLKRKHAAEGLTRSRLKRQFGPQKIEPAFSPVVSASQIDQNDEAAEEIADVDMMDEDPGIDFRAVAAQLRQDVLDDEDPSDDEELPPADSITNPRSLEGLRPKRVRLFFGTRVAIELKELFDYETGDDKEGLGFFKQAGLVNLEKELEIYNLSTRELEEGIEYGIASD